MPEGKGTYGSKVGRPPKKYQSGGLVKGKSHKDGGELIEVEGNEIVVNDSVNGAAEMHGEELLALNENPEDYIIVPKDQISNAMERVQVFRDEDVA